MSLLSVTVKKARYVGIQATQFNTYVTLKLQNVKSTTVTVKGPTPCWEQDFLFETNDINLGLLVEVWNKGVIWDRALGYHYLPLTSVAYTEQECGGRWIELEAQLMMRGGAVVGTTGPTGHTLLLDCRFEPPFDELDKAKKKLKLVEFTSDIQTTEEESDINKSSSKRKTTKTSRYISSSDDDDNGCKFPRPPPLKKHVTNYAEGTGGADLQRKLDLLNGTLDAERAEQARRQMQYIAHSGYSEDSDYTSDLNYPVGQHANCSASQFRSAAHQMHTPQRSLEASRENSYERDEYHMHGDADPLYYNSQPRTRIESWAHQYQPELRAQASVESAISWRTATEWQSTEEQRMPSLERQNTLYDDMSYSFEAYTASTQIRDHSHISQQVSYEEYFDSTSYPYQTSYVGDDSRQWDSGGRYFYDDGYGLTPTEYENIMNKRRSSVVQLPQIPGRQLPASSRYSDYNGMTPYRPRQRRTTASLPATPSSTPKRGRALPQPPGSESGSVRSRGRRLPRPPQAAPAPTHVPYIPEPVKTIPDASYGYDSFGYQPEYPRTLTDQYQDTNYSTTYDEDGMQPFFDETPHATPPVQKTPWSATETTSHFTYPVTSEDDTLLSKTIPSTVASYLPQLPVTLSEDQYQDHSYSEYDQQFDQQYPQNGEVTQYTAPVTQYGVPEQTYQPEPAPKPFQDEFYQEPKPELTLQQQFDAHKKQQQQQHLLQQQQKQPAQQLQSTVMTGAATLGSLMAGGAKKLGSFFGAAAAAVSAPPVAQPPATTVPSITPFPSAVAPVTPFTSAATATVPSVPDGSPAVPVTPSTPVALPRTPSLRRQESIQRPPVRRIRTLPDAPEDLPPSTYDESAYDDEYHKTEYDQTIDRVSLERDRSSIDRTSLDRYREDDYTIQEEAEDLVNLPDEPSPSLQKQSSPTRNGSHIRKPSVDSYHSQAPSVIDRRTSQSSFQDKLSIHIPTTQEESLAEKSKISFKEERPRMFHEVPEGTPEFQEDTYDEQQDEFRDEREPYQEEEFRDDTKFQGDEQFNETDDQYQEVFQEGGAQPQAQETRKEQPKLTPKQRWHRAYNKIVMQLNVSTLFNFDWQ